MAEKISKHGEVKTAADGVAPDYRNHVVHVEGDGLDDKAFAEAVARKLTRPEVSAAAVIENWQKDTHDINELVAELSRQVETVNRGDLRRAEGMLIGQAHALENIFVNLARRATNQEFLKQWEAYMRMALKAQNQCRMTLETLAAIKSPPVVIARQANINNGGQQQVNNGAEVVSGRLRAGARAHAANSAIEQTGLLEATDGQRLDTGTARTTSRTDSHLAALEDVDRPAHGRGQGSDGA